MNYIIRRATHGDAAGIINSHVRSIREICSKDYNPEQINAWAGRDFKIERWHQTMDRDYVWVVSNAENEIFGFGHLILKQPNGNTTSDLPKQGTIAGLYFVPEIVGSGLGSALVNEILSVCSIEQIAMIHLWATKTAKGFYEKMGFKIKGEITQMKMGNEYVECWEMTRSL